MARDCPKNSNRNFNPNACKTTTDDKNTSSPPKTTTTTNTTTSTKLTRAQQIRVLEEAMEDEECATYLDARDMGSDFWSAGA